jgi:arginine N-succinyltransferase
MDTHPLDQIEIRAGTTEHFEDLCQLARHLNTVNLPDDPDAIRALLERSERSFSGEIADPRNREYVFVLWDEKKLRVIGTSMIIAQLGRRGVPYIFLEVRCEEKYSDSLDRHFVHRVLTTRYSYDGPTELGGLVMHPDARRSPARLGSLISYVRLLFIAMHRSDFRDELIAELLPPLEPDGTSHLWEAYGRKFTGLSYREADRLSRSNKEFVRNLFPSEIYASLLPEDAQQVIGEVGAETRGVEKMLRRIGFEYAERVDPFDGGPHFAADTDRVTLIAAAREREVQLAAEALSSANVAASLVEPSVIAGGGEGRPEQLGATSPASGGRHATARAFIARSYAAAPYFRAVPVRQELGTEAGEPLLVPARLLKRFGHATGDNLWWMPLP